jgi:hypothetical protein
MALIYHDNAYRTPVQEDQKLVSKVIVRGGVGRGKQSRVALSTSHSVEYR